MTELNLITAWTLFAIGCLNGFSRDIRPWGWMVRLIDFGIFWVKIIRVHRMEHTSRQRHYLRSEIHIGYQSFGWRHLLLQKVPVREIHQLHSGIYIEVAYGWCDEDDIDRLEDKYGRT